MASRDALWAQGHDESVEVNQRALIDKVLARYSGEFTVFRELLQNSDDAQATAVEIHFNRDPALPPLLDPLPDLKSIPVHRWSFKNNGVEFRDEDWSRLKKIAEGNPDEDKIGAFGVGFYSLFSVTEEPFVTSGDKWMGFYWKDQKDQLTARRGQFSAEERQAWTTFDMKLRDPSPMPLAFDFARFLSSSITFMSHLSEISVFFGEDRLMKVSKTKDFPESLRLPAGLTRVGPKGLMHVVGMNRTPLHIKAEVMRWVYSEADKPPPPPVPKETKSLSAGGFFSSVLRSLNVSSTPQRSPTPLPAEPTPMVDPRMISETNVSLAIYSADVAVKLGSKLDSELLRSTKKRAPSKLSYQLIYTAKDKYDASMLEDNQQTFATGSIFQGLRADLNGTGTAKVFIGHATGQTTGVGGHMAARFIPTVERESIDLMDRNVALWNQELIFVGGWLSRATYDLELADIGAQWTKASGPEGPSSEVRSKLIERAIHTLRFFTFHRSTPSQQVSQLLLDSFFSCGKNTDFLLITTMGVRKVSEIRRPDAKFAGFLKVLPVLPDDVVTSAPIMISALESRGMLKNIIFDDVLNELRNRPLPEDEMVACLKWWITTYGDSSPSRELLVIRKELLDAAILIRSHSISGKTSVIPLSTIKTFLNTKSSNMSIPLDGPLPDDMLPVSVTKELTPHSLAKAMPWEELTIPQWVRYICREDVCANDAKFDISKSIQWADRVLIALSKHWMASLSKEQKTEIVADLLGRTCIPTRSHGVRKPQDAYFQNAALFPDLPVITFPSGTAIKGPLEKLLIDVGVRKHVELQLVFNRMIKTNEWSTYDLVKYLASVRTTLEPDEWSKLKITPTFYREGAQQGDAAGKPIKNKASDLYEPTETFRALRLPVLEWHGQKWRGNSEEAKFLFELGLRRQPPLGDLLQLCASQDDMIRAPAFKYLIDNINVKYQNFNPAEHPDIAYIPAVNALAGKVSLSRHNQVYSNPDWSHFELTVTTGAITPEIAAKLKIQSDPSTSLLVSLLEKRTPKDEAEAGLWFGILARRIADFTKPELVRLSQLFIVPVTPAGETLRLFPPSRCYFRRGDASTSVQSKLFVFVDFGATANSFLAACGTKRNPTIEEIAQMLLNDPETFRHLAGNDSEYLDELRNLAINARALSQPTLRRLQRGKVLLGIKRIPKSTKNASVEPVEEDEMEMTTCLLKAEDIVIADDNVALQYFGEKLFTAPQEDILEDFYIRLGSKRLSTLVKDEYRSGPESPNSKRGSDLRALILERLPLFLHEHTHAKLQIQSQWLNSPANFMVRAFNKLEVTKSLRFNTISDSRRQDAYSVAIRKSKSAPLELWIADNQKADYFEVANSLNRFLFESPKTNDALLFMTILMTDLNSLRRRGYNVSRILKQQEVARELRAKQAAPLPPPRPPSPAPSSSQSTLVPSSKESSVHLPPTTSTPIQDRARSPSPNNLVQNFRRFIKGSGSASSPAESSGGGLRPTQQPTQGGKQGATPLSNINSNISQAVNACRPENGNMLRNREQMRQVSESLQDGYCDISGQAGDLNCVGQIGETKVYLPPDVPDQRAFLLHKHESLSRFVRIIGDLSTIYELPITSLHVFYDVEGGLIAFNRNASIFLNLRYYEAWHDESVSRHDTNTAFISWYFTLAHEIAHNLVQPHNSEHEFYFSAISEKYLLNLNRHLK